MTPIGDGSRKKIAPASPSRSSRIRRRGWPPIPVGPGHCHRQCGGARGFQRFSRNRPCRELNPITRVILLQVRQRSCFATRKCALPPTMHHKAALSKAFLRAVCRRPIRGGDPRHPAYPTTFNSSYDPEIASSIWQSRVCPGQAGQIGSAASNGQFQRDYDTPAPSCRIGRRSHRRNPSGHRVRQVVLRAQSRTKLPEASLQLGPTHRRPGIFGRANLINPKMPFADWKDM